MKNKSYIKVKSEFKKLQKRYNLNELKKIIISKYFFYKIFSIKNDKKLKLKEKILYF